MKRVKFDNLNPQKTIGKVKDFDAFFKNTERVGGFNVGLLREFLRHLDKDDVVGVYIDKKRHIVFPLHSCGWIVASRIPRDRNDVIELNLEGR